MIPALTKFWTNLRNAFAPVPLEVEEWKIDYTPTRYGVVLIEDTDFRGITQWKIEWDDGAIEDVSAHEFQWFMGKWVRVR